MIQDILSHAFAKTLSQFNDLKKTKKNVQFNNLLGTVT